MDLRRAFHTPNVTMIRAMEKTAMTKIQATGIVVDVLDDPEAEDDKASIPVAEAICVVELVAGRGAKVEMVVRT
jgi:hypothetical protein